MTSEIALAERMFQLLAGINIYIIYIETYFMCIKFLKSH